MTPQVHVSQEFDIEMVRGVVDEGWCSKRLLHVTRFKTSDGRHEKATLPG